MPTRTYLTTPPGHQPQLDTSGDGVVERWVPGLGVPVEPPVPPRRRRTPLVIAVVVALVVGLLAVVAIRLVTDAQAEDPALGASAGQR